MSRAGKWIQRDVQVQKNDPGDNDRQAPFGALELGADVIDRTCVVRVDVKLDVLEIGRVVEHVKYQTKRENGSRHLGTKTRRLRTSRRIGTIGCRLGTHRQFARCTCQDSGG